MTGNIHLSSDGSLTTEGEVKILGCCRNRPAPQINITINPAPGLDEETIGRIAAKQIADRLQTDF